MREVKMREVKILCRRKGYEVSPHRVVEARVLTDKGTIENIPVVIFDKNPTGNWIFTSNGQGYSTYTFKESLDWKYTGPVEIPDHIKKMSPGIGVRHGDKSCEYVTIEDALMEMLEDLKGEIRQGEFALVATPENASAIKYLVDNGWPEERIENISVLIDKPEAEPESETDFEIGGAEPEPEPEIDFGIGGAEPTDDDS